MEKTVLIVLDAFRHDYIDAKNTPFLYSLLSSSKYYKKLVPSYGFCERTEIMVGVEANESNYFTAIGYDLNSPYKEISFFLKILSRVEKNSPIIIKKIIRRALWEYISRKEYGFASVNIPIDLLPNFSLTEDGVESLIKKSPNSIINMASNNGKSVNLSSFTSLDSKMIDDDDGRINKLITQIRECNDSLHLLYISSADHFGHKYGPDSDEFKSELFNLDAKLKNLYFLLDNHDEDINWMYVGDHGMTQIEKKIDVIKYVKSVLSDYIFGVDYIYFADSTVFRFWFLNEESKACINIKIKELFSLPHLSENGKLTTEKEIGLKGDRSYGDILWLASPSVIISPDFFNTKEKKLNGMHGYNPLLSDTCLGMAILKGRRFEKEVIERESLTCVYEELKRIIFDEP